MEQRCVTSQGQEGSGWSGDSTAGEPKLVPGMQTLPGPAWGGTTPPPGPGVPGALAEVWDEGGEKSLCPHGPGSLSSPHWALRRAGLGSPSRVGTSSPQVPCKRQGIQEPRPLPVLGTTPQLSPQRSTNCGPASKARQDAGSGTRTGDGRCWTEGKARVSWVSSGSGLCLNFPTSYLRAAWVITALPEQWFGG